MAAQTRTVTLYSLILPFAAGMGVWMTARELDSRGGEFYETGKEVAEKLDSLATASRTHDKETLAAAFGADYSGGELGLLNPTLVSTIDGIDTLHFRGGSGR